jgi:hypothetical protein
MRMKRVEWSVGPFAISGIFAVQINAGTGSAIKRGGNPVVSLFRGSRGYFRRNKSLCAMAWMSERIP